MFSAMATVHDFHLVGYSVDVDTRTIVLRTEWRWVLCRTFALRPI